MNIYQKKLIDHYHHPCNNGHLENPDFSTQEYNPSCGDLVTMQGKVKNNKVTDLRFMGKGCIISQACASLLTQECNGKTVQQILELNNDAIQQLLGISLGLLRLKCALLPLHALQEGIKEYLKTHCEN